jgi:hypothetical protein
LADELHRLGLQTARQAKADAISSDEGEDGDGDEGEDGDGDGDGDEDSDSVSSVEDAEAYEEYHWFDSWPLLYDIIFQVWGSGWVKRGSSAARV